MNKKGLSDKTILKVMWILVIAMAIYLAIKIIQDLI